MTQQFMRFDTDQYGPWIVTHKADKACTKLADRHYSRQTIGAKQFTRPGDNLVLRTSEGDAVWVSWRSKFPRKDGLDAYENTHFRNESQYLSSDLIKWAIFATCCEWGEYLPRDGLITYVQSSAVTSSNPGSCYRQAGFKRIGKSKSRGLELLQLSVSQRYFSLQEIGQIKLLECCKDEINVALQCGEWSEAVELYKEAQGIQTYLNSLKSARYRLKHAKWDSYQSVEEPEMFFLNHFSSDGWISEEWLEV